MMAKAIVSDAPAPRSDLQKRLLGLLQENTIAGANIYDVFRDWVALHALALANAVDRRGWAEREAEYLRIAGRYSREQIERFGQACGLLALILEVEGFGDVLGTLFASLALGSKSGGQFFTPYHLCRLAAQLTFSAESVAEQVTRKGFVTVQEPACGAGAMLIAAAEQMHSLGFNPQQQMCATAIDIDLKSVQMTYVQLTLLGIPAVVMHGDTLRATIWSVWYTPFYILDGWGARLRAVRADTEGAEELGSLAKPQQERAETPGQLALFAV